MDVKLVRGPGRPWFSLVAPSDDSAFVGNRLTLYRREPSRSRTHRAEFESLNESTLSITST